MIGNCDVIGSDHFDVVAKLCFLGGGETSVNYSIVSNRVQYDGAPKPFDFLDFVHSRLLTAFRLYSLSRSLLKLEFDTERETAFKMVCDVFGPTMRKDMTFCEFEAAVILCLGLMGYDYSQMQKKVPSVVPVAPVAPLTRPPRSMWNWRNPVEEAFIARTNCLFASVVEVVEVISPLTDGVDDGSSMVVCSKCWVVLEMGINYFPQTVDAVLICDNCIRVEDPMLVEVVDLKKCKECGVVVSLANCSKSQLRHNRPKCVSCIIPPPAPVRSKLKCMIDENERSFDRISNLCDGVFIDFECALGDRSKVTQCGVTTIDKCCGRVRVTNFVVLENEEFLDNFVSNSDCQFGSTFKVELKMLCAILQREIQGHGYVCTYASSLDLFVLKSLGIEVRKHVDLQLLIGDTDGKLPGLSTMLLMFKFRPSGLHCAGNDSYWTFVLFFSMVNVRGRIFDTILFGDHFKDLFDFFLSTPCTVRDFVLFQYDMQLCNFHSEFPVSGSSLDLIKHWPDLPRNKIFPFVMSHLTGEHFPDDANIVLGLV